MNTSLTNHTLQLWGAGTYDIGITGWNRWGQSILKVNHTVTVLANVTPTTIGIHTTTSTSNSTSTSTTTRTKKGRRSVPGELCVISRKCIP